MANIRKGIRITQIFMLVSVTRFCTTWYLGVNWFYVAGNRFSVKVKCKGLSGNGL